jgi:hypothetical protein
MTYMSVMAKRIDTGEVKTLVDRGIVGFYPNLNTFAWLTNTDFLYITEERNTSILRLVNAETGESRSIEF